MTLRIPTRPTSLLSQKTHRHVTCWELRRTDNLILRFTDHCHSLVLADGYTYSPTSGGTDVSARERQGGLNDINAEAKGIISSDAITLDDLQQGKFDNAKVTEKIVDWKYPWMEPFTSTVFYIFDLGYDGEIWTAQVSSLPASLRTPIGRVHSRTCDAILGDGRCKASLAAFSGPLDIQNVLVDRQIFQIFHPAGLSVTDQSGIFDQGYIVWGSGSNSYNVGVVSDIKGSAYDAGTFYYTIELWIPTPFSIHPLDVGTIVMGCDGNASTCKGRFNNLINFRGFPTMPGTKRTISNPGA